MQKIYTADYPAEAHFFKGILENEGIAAEVTGEALFMIRGDVPMTEETLPAVWVLRDDDAERAAGIVARLREQRERFESTGASWVCPQCGEIHEPQFTQCWKCGADRAEER